jgi:hypothetical protein
MPDFNLIHWNSVLDFTDSYFHKDRLFIFLNRKYYFSKQIDWNFSNFGKLWTYNLNYFEFLNQKKITVEIGLNLIFDYIKNDKSIVEGKEPYTISLRGMNWIKFLSENKIKNEQIDKVLYRHYNILLKNLEFHLLGNHLLENAFSLLFASYYYQDEVFYNKSKSLLILELDEQILADGAHYELSPMYHKIIFNRLLDSLHLIKNNIIWTNIEFTAFLENKASLMHSWLINITYKDGTVPMVNDSAPCISASSFDLFYYSNLLKIPYKQLKLTDSGYRKFVSDDFELFMDCGNIGPDYQPGHAHSDTFNFELIKKGMPVIVDTGISTYEKDSIRKFERSTESHNTVVINNEDQSKVWGGFRVANRAKIIQLIEQDNFIMSTHNGYKKKNIFHTRKFSYKRNVVIIEDLISRSTNYNAVAYFHLHDVFDLPIVKNSQIILPGIKILFSDNLDIKIEEYDLAKGFNLTKKAYKIKVIFDKKLKTIIYL